MVTHSAWTTNIHRSVIGKSLKSTVPTWGFRRGEIILNIFFSFFEVKSRVSEVKSRVSWKQSTKWQLNCFCCFVKTYFVKKIEHLCFELQCFWVFSTFETVLEYFIVLNSVLEGLYRFWNVLDFWSVLDFFRLFYSMVFMCFWWFLECL